MRTFAAACFALVLLSGCAAPIQATRNLPQPQSLDEVNTLLDGKRVTIEIEGGEMYSDVHSASVDRQWVRYATGNGSTLRRGHMPVESVARITYVRNRGTKAGTLIGAAPGVAMLLGSGGLLIASSRSNSGNAWVGALAAIVGGMTGAGMLAIGAPLGGVIGAGVSPGGIVPLYEAPLARYLDASAAAPTE